jgi:hypothetical protein
VRTPFRPSLPASDAPPSRHPDRIERPLLRADGRLVPVWEDCLDDLGDRLRAIVTLRARG